MLTMCVCQIWTFWFLNTYLLLHIGHHDREVQDQREQRMNQRHMDHPNALPMVHPMSGWSSVMGLPKYMDHERQELPSMHLPMELLPMVLPMLRVRDQQQLLANIRLRCKQPMPIWLQKLWTENAEKRKSEYTADFLNYYLNFEKHSFVNITSQFLFWKSTWIGWYQITYLHIGVCLVLIVYRINSDLKLYLRTFWPLLYIQFEWVFSSAFSIKKSGKIITPIERRSRLCILSNSRVVFFFFCILTVFLLQFGCYYLCMIHITHSNVLLQVLHGQTQTQTTMYFY